MRHRNAGADGPALGLWDAAAARAPPARMPTRRSRAESAQARRARMPDPQALRWSLIAVAVPVVAFLGSLVLPHRPLDDLGAGFIDWEHRFLQALNISNTTNATLAPTVAPLDVVYFPYGVISQFTPGLTIFANIAFVMFCLKQLLHMATAQVEDFPEYRFVKDEFQSREEGQNWNYNFVIVTSIKDEGHVLTSGLQRRNSMRNIVSALENADLGTEQYKSRKFDKVFIKVRASRERLEEEADRLNMRFRLDERTVKQRLLDGQPDPLDPDEFDVYPRKNGWTYKGFPMETAITDTEDQCPYAYYECIYGEYRSNPELQALYQKYPRTSSMFRSVDRVKLIMSIIRADPNENGGGLVLEKLIKAEIIMAAFPLHDRSELQACQAKWLVYWGWPWAQPFTKIKDYFGEKIGLYFVFLGHYTEQAGIAAILGVIVWMVSCTTGGVNAPVIPFFCIVMSVWATVFLETWKRKQSRYSMEWGMVGIEDIEEERPDFLESDLVIEINSPIDGEEVKYFPPEIAARRSLIAWTVIIVASTAVMALVCATFFLKAFLAVRNNLFNSRHWNCSEGQRQFSGSPKCIKNYGIPRSLGVDFSGEIGNTLVSIAQAAQIFMLENVFNELALALNKYENHSTDTAFTDKLTEKVFIFQSINSFFSYIYIAFFKQLQANRSVLQPIAGNYSCKGTCMSELNKQLQAIFISKVVLANVKEIMIPHFLWQKDRIQEKRRADLDEMAKQDRLDEFAALGEEPPEEEEYAGREVSPAEREFELDEYHQMLGTFADYRDLVLIYGYTVLFVAALPLAPLLALINAYAQIRVDAWNISVMSRRPWPENAEDIGSWADIIELLSYIAVFTNSIIIAYTGEFLTHWTNAYRIVVFAFLYHGMVAAKLLAALVIDDVPGDVQIQIDRQEFVEKKLIFCAADDQIEVPNADEGDGDAPDVTIFDQDDSVVYLDYPGYAEYARERKREIFMSRRKGATREPALTSL